MFWADLPRVSGAIDGSSRGTCPVLGSGGLGSQVLPSVQRDLAGKVPSHLDSRHLPGRRSEFFFLAGERARWMTASLAEKITAIQGRCRAKRKQIQSGACSFSDSSFRSEVHLENPPGPTGPTSASKQAVPNQRH